MFGAPNDLADHADAAVSAAVLIHRLVTERFDGALRIGIGINTGLVIAGTIGGGGKLEFTLIGDTVSVASRVEQLTKTTGDAILLTQQTVDALVSRPPGVTDRGAHALKGKSAPQRFSASTQRPRVCIAAAECPSAHLPVVDSMAYIQRKTTTAMVMITTTITSEIDAPTVGLMYESSTVFMHRPTVGVLRQGPRIR